jgi:hypothetical protein
MPKPNRLTFRVTPSVNAVDYSDQKKPYEVHADQLEFSSQGAAIFVFFLEEVDHKNPNMDPDEPMYVPRPALVLQSDQWLKIEEIFDGKPLHSYAETVFVTKPEKSNVPEEKK